MCPSSPLLLPKPPGQISVALLNNTQAEFNAEAFKNTILALNVYVLFVSESSTSTPSAFLVFLLYKSLVTIEKGLTVKLPVFNAAGIVEDCVLK